MLGMEPNRATARRERRRGAGGALHRLSALGFCFLLGGMFGLLGLQPIRFMGEGLVATLTLIEELRQTRPELLSPITHSGEGVVVHDPDRASAGLTLVQGLLPGGPQVRLIDMTGREIHRWNVDFFGAWEDPDHIVPAENIPKSEFNYHTQGFAVRPDGSILVHVGHKGAINLDRCGRVLWTVDRMTHHSVTPVADGGYWVPAHKPVDQVEERLLPPTMSRTEVIDAVKGDMANPVDTVLKLDAAGEPVKEFAVLQAFLDAGLEAALHDAWVKRPMDPTHLNDIEIVTPALAARLSDAEAGDVLISLRDMNMLAVLDRADGDLKWHKRGPWLRQHDPDITPEGIIEVYDNGWQPDARLKDGSRILAYDPATDRTRILHPKGAEDSFYTEFMGSHQRLPNGNRLIVESYRGRIIEVTQEGDVVWSYVLPYDDTHAALIEHAERVPPDFFHVADWTCDPAHG